MRTQRQGLLTGLASLLALLALVAGIPVGLFLFGSRWVPDHIPSWTEITTVLTRPDTGEVFFGLSVILGWLGWALFAVSVILEIPAQLRQVHAPRLPGFAGGQRLAGLLIAGVLTLLPAAHIPGSASPSAPTLAAVSAPAEVAPDPATTEPAAQLRRAPTATSWAYTVQRGDTLWGLAERHLGDGQIFGDPGAQRGRPTGRRHVDGPQRSRPRGLGPADAGTTHPGRSRRPGGHGTHTYRGRRADTAGDRRPVLGR